MPVAGKTFEPVLKKKGFAVHTLTLPGHGENARFGWFVGLSDYARAVCAAADKIVKESGAPCALLGHSMGGMVISAAAEARPQLFSELIYLAAFVPTRAPCTMLDLVVNVSEASRPEGEPGMSPTQHFWRGILTMDAEAAVRFFYHKMSRATRARWRAAILVRSRCAPGATALKWTAGAVGAHSEILCGMHAGSRDSD